MRKNKFGFTLGEVLVCIVIIGIIMALSVHVIKIVKTSHTALTYFAFNNVNDIVAEVYAGNIPNEPGVGNNALMMCRKTRQLNDRIDKYVNILKPDFDIEYPVDEYGTRIIPRCSDLEMYKKNDNQNYFCNRVTSLLNTSGAIDCTNLYEVDQTGAEPTILNFDSDNPNFLTTNGQRYFLTERVFDSNISDTYGYRLLAIDLNGKSKPNIIRKDGPRTPDIVTFMIMDNGSVYPLGVAADNATSQGRIVQYLNPKVKGYYYNPSSENENIPPDCFLGTEQVCNYAVVFVPNTTTDPNNETTFYTYRQAYCNALGQRQSEHKTYCNGLSGHVNCPPSTDGQHFDMCRVELIKPMFRYNFR